jgi:diguanylate cyclase (GGDEF)-like protein
MNAFPKPKNEAGRLAALEDHQILDTPPDEAFDRITRLACRILKTPIALVSLVDAERQWLKSRQGLDAKEIPREFAFCAHAICDQEVMVVPDATADTRFADNPFVTQEPKIRFYAGAQLSDDSGHNLGTLCVIDTTPREIDDEQRAMLRDLASIIVDEMNLRRLASVDPLTGLPNRRHFMQLCEQEHRRALRYSHGLSIAIFDIDQFKLVNDRHGHDAGDAVLRAVSGFCTEALRAYDTVGRYGGDEFALLMPHTTLDQAEMLAGRLRALASKQCVDVHDAEVTFTISVGVTSCRVGEETIKDALARADEALYDAKAGGRNAVVARPPVGASFVQRGTRIQTAG